MVAKPAHFGRKPRSLWSQNPFSLVSKPVQFGRKTRSLWSQNPVTLVAKPLHFGRKTRALWSQNPFTLVAKPVHFDRRTRSVWSQNTFTLVAKHVRFWSAGLAAALPEIADRFPDVGAIMVEWLEAGGGPSLSLQAASMSARRLNMALERSDVPFPGRRNDRTPAAACPSWASLANRTAEPQVDLPGEEDQPEPGEWRHGWQFWLSNALEKEAQGQLLAASSPADGAMLHSQSGQHAADWLTSLPSSTGLTLEPRAFVIAIRRRLRLPLFLSELRCRGSSCRCPLDELGDHVAACMVSGMVQRRAVPLEQAWRTVLTEAGGRSVRKRLLNEFIPGVAVTDGRQIDAHATGLRVRRGLPLCIDATLRSVLTRGGDPIPGASTGASSFAEARADKIRVSNALFRSRG